MYNLQLMGSVQSSVLVQYAVNGSVRDSVHNCSVRNSVRGSVRNSFDTDFGRHFGGGFRFTARCRIQLTVRFGILGTVRNSNNCDKSDNHFDPSGWAACTTKRGSFQLPKMFYGSCLTVRRPKTPLRPMALSPNPSKPLPKGVQRDALGVAK